MTIPATTFREEELADPAEDRVQDALEIVRGGRVWRGAQRVADRAPGRLRPLGSTSGLTRPLATFNAVIRKISVAKLNASVNGGTFHADGGS
jgi:hypothetical protein